MFCCRRTLPTYRRGDDRRGDDRRGDDRRGGGGGGSDSGPMTFKQFLVQKVGDDVSPQEAQELYDQYLTNHFGNQLRARFEQEKGQKG